MGRCGFALGLLVCGTWSGKGDLKVGRSGDRYGNPLCATVLIQNPGLAHERGERVRMLQTGVSHKLRFRASDALPSSSHLGGIDPWAKSPMSAAEESRRGGPAIGADGETWFQTPSRAFSVLLRVAVPDPMSLGGLEGYRKRNGCVMAEAGECGFDRAGFVVVRSRR